MTAVRALAVLAVISAAGCGGDQVEQAGSSLDPRRNVLVIDDGFDLTLPVFRGRVAAAYSIVCDQSSGLVTADTDAATPTPVEVDAGAPVGVVDGGLQDRKAALITSLQLKDTRCRLNPGVEPKPDPLASIARYRDRWNQAIRSSKYASTVFTQAERAEIEKAMNELSKARFHGSATAGVVAHNNAGVRLVLVEERLGSAEMAEATFTCIVQQEVDDNVALFTDPQVRQAYIDRPFSRLEEDFRELAARHRIGVVNESFGIFSRQRLEELQTSKGCLPVDLRQYFTTLGELDAARALAHPEPDSLVVKSAGNDGSRLDSTADHPMCNMPGTPRLIVGAYDDTGLLTDFTNFGSCVDVVAPGSQIITPIPGNWYLPLSGTSFAAPLTARLISVNPEPVPYQTASARSVVLSMRDSTNRIPLHRFPRELIYDPDMNANKWALRLMERTMPAAQPINLRKLRELQDLLRVGRARNGASF